jgi:hypothetical protein
VAVVAAGLAGWAAFSAKRSSTSSGRSAAAAEGMLKLEHEREEQARLSRRVRVRADPDPVKKDAFILGHFGEADAVDFMVSVEGAARVAGLPTVPQVFREGERIPFALMRRFQGPQVTLHASWIPVNERDPGKLEQSLG